MKSLKTINIIKSMESSSQNVERRSCSRASKAPTQVGRKKPTLFLPLFLLQLYSYRFSSLPLSLRLAPFPLPSQESAVFLHFKSTNNSYTVTPRDESKFDQSYEILKTRDTAPCNPNATQPLLDALYQRSRCLCCDNSSTRTHETKHDCSNLLVDEKHKSSGRNCLRQFGLESFVQTQPTT